MYGNYAPAEDVAEEASGSFDIQGLMRVAQHVSLRQFANVAPKLKISNILIHHFVSIMPLLLFILIFMPIFNAFIRCRSPRLPVTLMRIRIQIFFLFGYDPTFHFICGPGSGPSGNLINFSIHFFENRNLIYCETLLRIRL
jgi:hypothetical protein